ncbi:FxSxx-COOH system tetratricopeptide repeat protein [Microbispora sp. H10885]|uniref:FxSxx-COOH system tetratricopeptide repeat protein n=1 Tax=Microbispora sp. H10885 TaxID=2729110 RepID=UPI0016005D8C|nr:FxSxx-COOH system tetratricopeptide repeat protein [Microbispora sp. H10885]
MLLVAAGVVELVADPLHIDAGVLDVLDKRASFLGMLLGAAGLVVSVWGLRPGGDPAPPSAGGPSSTGAGSPVVGGAMSGGMIVGQVTGGQVIGPGGVSGSGDRAVVVGGDARGPVLTGDIASLTMTTVSPPAPAPALPSVSAVGVPSGGLMGMPRVPSRVFIGRDDQLAELGEALRSGPGVIAQAVVGLGGVGKSELALHYAHTRRADYELVWWVSADTVEGIQAGLAELCRALCVAVGGQAGQAARQAPEQEAAAWALAWLTGMSARWLMIFDNVEDIDHLQPLLGRLTRGHVLVTTRRDVGWEDLATVIRLDVLPRPAAVDLLAELMGPAVAGDREALEELAGELDGLPLALKQAGAYIAHTPGITVAAYLELLRTAPARALTAHVRPRSGPGSDAQEVVARVWAVTGQRIGQQSPLAARVLRVLACYAPDELPWTVLHGLDGAGPAEVAEALGVLASYSMITRSPDGQLVSVHRLVQVVTLAGLSSHEGAEARSTSANLLQAALPEDPERTSSWPVYARLLPHARVALPAESPGMRTVVNYLLTSGDYRNAKTLQHRHASALQDALGSDHPSTLIARADLAYLTGEAGEAAAARDLLAELVPVMERVLGAEHPDTLTAQANLAAWTGAAGDTAAARDLLAELVPVMERVLGAEHPSTLIARGNLARWTGEAGDAAAARDLLAELVPVMERVLGAEHPSMLIARGNVAYVTGTAGEAAAARDLLAELVPVMERVLGAEHPSTLIAQANLARWTGEAGDAAAARDLFAELVPVQERASGPEHPDTLTAQANLATWTGMAGDAAAARDLFAELVPVQERASGPEHPSTLTAQANLATWTGVAGDAAAARGLFAALVPVRERVLGAEHPSTLTARGNLAWWTGMAGDAAAARDLFAELVPVRERVSGPEHPDTLTAQANLATWTGMAGDAAAARDLFAELVPVRERVSGPEHPDTLTARTNLDYLRKQARGYRWLRRYR